jgi:hypothetical protein
MAKLAYTYIPSSDFEDEDGEPLPDDAPYDCRDTAKLFTRFEAA